MDLPIEAPEIAEPKCNGRFEPLAKSIANNRFKTCTISTIAWMLLAHAYRWMGGYTLASHDSLATMVNHDAAFEISLGRFLQPAYIALRGSVSVPVLIGILSTVFAIAVVVVLVFLFDIKQNSSIIILSGIISTNSALTLAFATYSIADIKLLALLFSILAVYCCSKWKHGLFLSAVFTTLSLGLYQDQIASGIAIALIYAQNDLMSETKQLKSTITFLLKYLASILIGGCAYYFAMKGVMSYYSIAAYSGYNGLAGLGDYSSVSMLSLLAKAYSLPFFYMSNPDTFASNVAGCLNCLILCVTIIGFIRLCLQRKLPISRIVLSILAILFLPLIADCIFIISKGVVHGLMTWSFYLSFYLFALNIYENNCNIEGDSKPCLELIKQRGIREKALSSIIKIIPVLLIGPILASNIVFSNQVYASKDAISKATLSAMTRLVDRIEQVDGYIPGETPVAFVGSLGKDYLASRSEDYPPYGHESQGGLYGVGLSDSGGIPNNASVTYPETYGPYIRNVLGCKIKCAPSNTVSKIKEKPEVQTMEPFPASDCCLMVDEVLVIKLS